MANNCFYTMTAVSPKKENLERLIRIMNYKDDEYFIYRCFSAEADEIEKNKDGLYEVHVCGDVAWAADKWFSTEENKEILVNIGYEKNADGTFNYEKQIYGTSHYITLDLLCPILDIGIELFSEESGCCFQEHCQVNHRGEIIGVDSVEWTQEWMDEDGNELDAPIEKGGYGDDYCVFAKANEIYG